MQLNILLMVVLLLLGEGEVLSQGFGYKNLPAIPAGNGRDPTKFRIGMALSKTPQIDLPQFGPLFVDYLQQAVGSITGKTFELYSVGGSGDPNYLDVYASSDILDMLFAPAGIVGCFAEEFNARVVASVIYSRPNGLESSAIAGAVFTRYGSTAVNDWTDFQDKKIVAYSPSGLGAYQAQAYEMYLRGLNILQLPAQITFPVDIQTISQLLLGIFRPGKTFVYDAALGRGDVLGALGLAFGPNYTFVVGVDAQVMNAVTWPTYPGIQVSTRAWPEFGLIALNTTGITEAQLIANALFALNASHPAMAAAGVSRWIAPLNYLPVLDMLTAIGILSNGRCLKSADAFDYIFCPAGTAKPTRLEASLSCAKAGLPCYPGAQCFCRPCIPVPTTALQVFAASKVPAAAAAATALAAVANSTGGVNATAVFCAKLSLCATVHQRESLVLTVVDALGLTLRAKLGLPPIGAITYSLAVDQLTIAAAAGGMSSLPIPVLTLGVAASAVTNETLPTWQVSIPMPAVSFTALTVFADGIALNDSPTILRVIRPTCPPPRIPNAMGACVCPESIVPQDDRCVDRYSLGGLIGGLVGATAALAAAALAITAVVRARRKRQPPSWAIKMADVVFSDPPEVLGVGSFGVVIRGTYRSTAVACKMARTAPAGVAPGPLRGVARGSSSVSAAGLASTTSDAAQGTVGSRGVEASRGVSLDAPGRSHGAAQVRRRSLRQLADQDAVEGSSSTPTGRRSSRLQPALVAYLRRSVGGRQATASVALGTASQADDGPAAAITSSAITSSSPAATASLGRASSGGSAAWLESVHRALASPAAVRPGSVGRGETLCVSDSPGGQPQSRSCGSWAGAALGCWTGGGRSGVYRTRALLKEIEQLVRLRHPRVVAVLGAVIEPEVVLVMEYCARGSLHDLLMSALPMGADVLTSVIKDIVAGMAFLHAHDPPVLHNDLKSANVLLDAAFQARLADFGLSMKTTSAGIAGTPAFMAPEVLRGDAHSTASDVYAFGILLTECFARAAPYAGEPLLDALEAVADDRRYPPHRPTLPETVPAAWADLIAACVHPAPEARPTFAAIGAQLADGRCLMDTMIAEATAAKVASATHLPPRVAALVAEGRAVEPETFAAVTCVFAAVARFAALSRKLDPEQVSSLLDRLHVVLDGLATKHGLFRAETTGESYLVFGNLACPQADHTARCAAFALDATRAARAVQIVIGGGLCCALRVGMHAGAAVGALVGKTSPKYLVLGESVAIAQRLERTGDASRVHLSETAAALLRAQAPAFSGALEPRGRIAVKGQPAMPTLWLDEDSGGGLSAVGSPKTPRTPKTPVGKDATGKILWTPGELLGKGAFGRVYLGLNRLSGDLLAAKVLDYGVMMMTTSAAPDARELNFGDRCGGPAAHGFDGLDAAEKGRAWLRSLEPEINLHRRLHHKHVVKFIGAQVEEPDGAGNPVLAIFMEYVPGGSIASLLEKFGTLDESVAKRYTRQLLRGLEYMHAMGVIHRDLKGANVLVSRAAGVKISDLGAACSVPVEPSVPPSLPPLRTTVAPAAAVLLPLAEGEVGGGDAPEAEAAPAATVDALRDSTVALSMRGSVYWMSPEILAGERYGRRTDVWSLGATLVEMLTGDPPFTDLVAGSIPPDPRAAAQRIVAHIAAGGRPELSVDASPQALDFLRQCFVVDPRLRPTASDLLKHPFVDVDDDEVEEEENDDAEAAADAVVLEGPDWATAGFGLGPPPPERQAGRAESGRMLTSGRGGGSARGGGGGRRMSKLIAVGELAASPSAVGRSPPLPASIGQ